MSQQTRIALAQMPLELLEPLLFVHLYQVFASRRIRRGLYA
jgi:hypothetical protein